MPKRIIFLCHTDRRCLQDFGGVLSEAGYEVVLSSRGQELAASLKASGAGVLILDERLARNGFLSLEKDSPKNDRCFLPPDCHLILLSRDVSIERAVKAMQAGASDFLPETVNSQRLLQSVDHLFNKSALKATTPSQNIDNARCILTSSPAMQQLLETAGQVAGSNATILIQGESGTGKELVAQYIHVHSGRNPETFVAMNCAALPENLAESELFGYEKGSFTGALRRKPGKFEQADGGTLLLDEISEMALPLQAKMLRALQEKRIDTVGGTRPVKIDTRIIATTNRDLHHMVQKGQFRRDLYYRLRVIPLFLPPLRSRKEDIPLLIDHFLKRFTPADRKRPEFSSKALARMLEWPWPGNVRELENTVERAVLISKEPEIKEHLLLLEEMPAEENLAPAANLVGLTVKELEQRLIEQTLSHVNQSRTSAAQMLGISIRTLRNKLHEYGKDQGLSNKPD